MGEKLRHRNASRSVRAMIVLTTVLALIASPLIVILTHGPAASASAAAMTAQMAEHIDAADHVHGHGHTHDDAVRDHPGSLFGGHNPADHDHQLHALVGQTAGEPEPLTGNADGALQDISRHRAPEGPRRPPRLV